MCKVRCWRWLFGNKMPISLRTVTRTMRREAHPSGCARCGAGAGCVAVKYQSLGRSRRRRIEPRPSARPVHLIITMIKWIRTSRMSMKYQSLSAGPEVGGSNESQDRLPYRRGVFPRFPIPSLFFLSMLCVCVKVCVCVCVCTTWRGKTEIRP